ncbi:MAG: ATP-binding protein involved in chromosome partitioning [Pseudomonadales bacterium]|jgi:ATP-binding protein involved in chromosome partitioning
MCAMSADLVNSALAAIEILPGASNLLSEDCIKDLLIDGDAVHLSLSLGMPVAGLSSLLNTQIVRALKAVGASSVDLTISAEIANNLGQTTNPNLAGVRNIIAVASGKGGVGKSTTAVNLASALHAEGAKVGLLDADIYGPSLQLMLGVPDGVRPGQHEGKFLIPVTVHGLKTMSMAYLVTDKTPMVWRGPMASSALQQMLSQTMWEELDYLVVDMPPGTGDIQLTLSQQVPVSGAVIVTTPQDIALLDAIKGVEMFQKVGVDVLGVVENMSYHQCTNCGNKDHLFGDGGGEKLAADYEVGMLGSLPLQRTIRELTDAGVPAVVAEPTSDIAQQYVSIARNTALRLWKKSIKPSQVTPSIEISDD